MTKYLQVLNDPIALSTWSVEWQSFQILSLKRYMYNKYHQANIEQLRSNAAKPQAYESRQLCELCIL